MPASPDPALKVLAMPIFFIRDRRVLGLIPRRSAAFPLPPIFQPRALGGPAREARFLVPWTPGTSALELAAG